MSTIEVKVCKVEVFPHDNADKLELVRVGGEGGWVCVTKKDNFKTGDLCLYVPEDSLLPDNIYQFLCASSKVAIHRRVRPTKIRGQLSQGICLKPEDWLPRELIFEDSDVTEFLKVKKWEPEPTSGPSVFHAKGTDIKYSNDNFRKYTGIERFQRYPKVFNDREVVATVKLHGTNGRFGIVKKSELTFWDKFKKFFGMSYSETEFLVGSHNVIRKPSKKALKYNPEAYKEDLYWRAATKYNLQDICKKMIDSTDPKPKELIIYGEIIGPGIQKGYDYGIENGEIELRIFDIMQDGKFLPWTLVQVLCANYGLKTVEEVYRGPWSLDVLKLAERVDEYGGKKYVREGIVIKTLNEEHDKPFRIIAKHLNPAYLLSKDNSEFH